MIYVKRCNQSGQLTRVEKGKRITADNTVTDTVISKREYACLTCALRIILDRIDKDTLSARDWGVDDE